MINHDKIIQFHSPIPQLKLYNTNVIDKITNIINRITSKNNNVMIYCAILCQLNIFIYTKN